MTAGFRSVALAGAGGAQVGGAVLEHEGDGDPRSRVLGDLGGGDAFGAVVQVGDDDGDAGVEERLGGRVVAVAVDPEPGHRPRRPLERPPRPESRPPREPLVLVAAVCFGVGALRPRA